MKELKHTVLCWKVNASIVHVHSLEFRVTLDIKYCISLEIQTMPF